MPWFKIICLGILLYMAVKILLAIPPMLFFCFLAAAVYCLDSDQNSGFMKFLS